jgi:deazaflavin-dependent oxidoreductase (nitroreductase family)
MIRTVVWVSRWMERWMRNRHRRKGYTFMGMDVLFLTTIGRRTGQRRETPVVWFPDGEDAWPIVASAAGSAHNPDWYHNLAAHPDQVWIGLPGRNLRVMPDNCRARAGRPAGGGWRRRNRATRDTSR